MEKINVAEILKKYPKYFSFYCTFLGTVSLTKIEKDNIYVHCNSKEYIFDKYGCYSKDNDCCIYPSKSMRNWKKLTWYAGDVVTDGRRIGIYDGFMSNDYLKFRSIYLFEDAKYYNNNDLITASFHKATKKESEKYIKGLEFYYKKTWNPETLTLEEPLSNKEGDFISYDSGDKTYILIVDKIEGSMIYIHAGMVYNGELLPCNMLSEVDITLVRDSVDAEVFMLLNKLAEDGLFWDAKEKKIKSFEALYEPETKCLFKRVDNNEWVLGYLSHRSGEMYIATGGNVFAYCIPYNDYTKDLLGYNFK